MPNLRRLLLGATLMLVASLAAASSVSAAPEKGADVVRQEECVTDPLGSTFCVAAKYVVNDTTTPSGNLSSHANGERVYKFTGAGPFEGCNSSYSDKFNYHFLARHGEFHEEGSRSHGEMSFGCGGDNVQCTYSYHSHYANGELQFSRPEFNCSPT